MKLVLPLLAALLAFCVVALAFYWGGRDRRRQRARLLERERLQTEVFPHLSEDERALGWTLPELRRLARMYRDDADYLERSG